MEQYNPKNPDEFKQENLEPPVPEPLNIIPVPDGSVVDKGSLSSPNYRKGQVGWRLRSDGGFEATDGVFTGEITALSGSIGGFDLGVDYLKDVADSFGLSSTVTGGDDVRFWAGDTFTNRATAPIRISESGVLIFSQSIGTVKMNTNGLTFMVGTYDNANIILSSGSGPVGNGVQLRFVSGGSSGGNGAQLDFTYTAANTGNFSPSSGKSIDLGTSSSYFNEINYKTLTDRGCLGFFDEGVEMQDGSKVSDVEALKAIKKSETEMSVHGVPMLDYATMPKAMYKPAPIAKEDIYENFDGDKKLGKLLFKKGEKMGHDGAETTSLISIMLGAIKELTGRVEILESEIIKLKTK